MHRLIFGHSFTELVALILLPGIAFYFLNKKKTSARRNAEDVDTGASSSMTVPTETNFGGSTLSLMETDKDASSSLTASTESPYEVFLSFRGPDTRHGFTDHLYHGLCKAGIAAFRDDDELCQGENIEPKLMAAITTSKILIPILSETYGTSRWCLDELVQIMERKNNNGQIVLPIFYKVKPADVRHQIGSFGDAFHEREKRLLKRCFDPAILKKWKKALDEVSTLKGYEANGYETELVRSIVRKVLHELKKKYELIVSKNLVGIDSHVKEVLEFVDNKSHATLFVGIHGMGGIGKTTLAKAIYNELSNQFEHRSFIADVRESWKRGVHYLQNQLIYDILKLENEVRNVDEGTLFISSKFKSKKVLVLIDDVDNVVQLKSLAGNSDWFSSGSRIIITTRNKRILEEARVDYDYDHKEMDDDQSLILFSKHAFRRDSPPREFEDLTHEVVSITGGLPLYLEVFGSLFCGKESTQWRDTIKKLKKVPHMEVQEKLRISYESLDYLQKQIFLDIACFFIGIDKRIASYMWNACGLFPKEGIEVLRSMSLIKIGDAHEFIMHDQLRDLGREIVCEENQQEPRYRSRLWDFKEVQKVLKENKGTDKIEAIYLSDFGKIVEPNGDVYTEKQFNNLSNLRFLHMECAQLNGDFKDSMEELRWLRWPFCPVNFEVKNFHVKELVILELQKSCINYKWKGWSSFTTAERLKYLDLTSCEYLENTIFLSAFKHLEVLILNLCQRLKQIDSSIGDMKALLRLELCWCQSLVELPAEIMSLENLEILYISHSGIEELPEGIGRLRKLRELRASDCSNLKGKMPISMCHLSSLKSLDVLGCNQLQSLPNLLPSSLTDLGITCRSHKLPSLCHLTHLKQLRVWDCKSLECIQMLSSTLLHNSECSQPIDVEESKLPQSPNTPFKLEILDVRGCRSMEMLDVSQFIHLRTLHAHDCENLLEVRGLDKSIYLESLIVFSCDSIERLFLPKSKSLKKLDAGWCKKLVKIHGLDRLEYLESLKISRCTSIERLDLPKLRRLKKLEVDDCKNLAEIQGLDRLKYLESLKISRCTSIERLDLLKSRRLKKLEVDDCKNLAEIQGLDRLEFLEELSISECKSLNSASSSLTASTKSYYEVFLSFRGPDTRHGFTNHLYNRLVNAGIDAFRDDDELCQGKNIRPKLMAAITTSKILIPILSVTYGTSSWCMDELVQIMERKNNNRQIVLPIFYKVKPSHVRHQLGSFGKAFREREKRLRGRSSFDPTILDKWKKALNEVSTLKGCKADGYKAEVVRFVVQKVLSELKKEFELVISKNLVGIDSHVKNVMELLDNKSHAPLFVGIHGMRGIGKTTLAKTIFNKLSNQFEHRSFIADIRESWKRGVHHLQNQLIHDILKQENGVRNDDEGINFISSKFKDKKVLVLLDDVDDVDQVKCLVGNHDWFASRSMIIITARNKRILEAAGVDHNYDLRELCYDQSLILFSKHAFRRDFPPSEFEDLTREVVSTIGGLPLSLEVLGSLLCGKKSKVWRYMIKKLKKVPRIEVQEKLKKSYDVLDYEQRQIFLDISCFLIGTDWTTASYMWAACDFFPRENIEVLRFMSLIKIGDNHELQMHDQLRDLGRTIVREKNQQQPWHCSRLWDSEEALKVLKRNKGTETEKVEALCLNFQGHTSVKLTREDFETMPNIRFLQLDHADIAGDFANIFPKLSWLRWHGCPQHLQITNFQLGNLTILDLSWSKVTKDWKGWDQIEMRNLKVLDLTGCADLLVTPKFSGCNNLAILILERCSQLVKIDHSIGNLQHLVSLNLKFCTELSMLPVEVGHLTALKELLMDGTSIQEIPISIGHLKRLESISASNCFSLSQLPRTIRHLTNISLLSLDGTRIIALPDSIGELVRLKHLSLRDCCQIRKLPNSIGNIGRSLVELDVSGTGVVKFPDSLKDLQNLKILRMDSCFFSEFPPDVGELTSLEEIHASWCRSLEGGIPSEIGKLHNLRILRLRHSTISSIPAEIHQLSNLLTLDLLHCDMIKELPRLPSSITVLCEDDELKSSHLP